MAGTSRWTKPVLGLNCMKPYKNKYNFNIWLYCSRTAFPIMKSTGIFEVTKIIETYTEPVVHGPHRSHEKLIYFNKRIGEELI